MIKKNSFVVLILTKEEFKENPQIGPIGYNVRIIDKKGNTVAVLLRQDQYPFDNEGSNV